MTDKNPIDVVSEMLADRLINDEDFRNRVIEKTGWRIYNDKDFGVIKEGLFKSLKDRMRNEADSLHAKYSILLEAQFKDWFKSAMTNSKFDILKERILAQAESIKDMALEGFVNFDSAIECGADDDSDF